MVEILQNFMAFSEYMNFNTYNGSLLSHKAPLKGLRLMALPALADDDDGVEDLPELLFV